MRSKRVELILDTLKAVRGAKDLSTATDRVADALGKTAREGDKAGQAVDKTGKEMSDAARAAAKLDREIDQLTGSLKELAVVQALSGDSMSKQIKEAEDKLRAVSKNRKLLGDGAEPAAGFVANLSAKMGPLLAKMPISGPMAAALAAAAAASAPFLAATIVGAVAGGAGLSGIGAGVALALRDPQIKAEAKNLGDFIDFQMRDSFGAFGPAAIKSIGIVRSKVADLREELDRIGDNSAGALAPLTGSMTEAVGDIIEGLDRVIQTSGPSMEVLGDGIEMLGEQTEIFLNMVASHADTGAKALGALFLIIESGLASLTVTIDLLATAYKWSTIWTSRFPGMTAATQGFAGASDMAGTSTGVLGEKIEETGKKVEVAKVKFVALEEILAQTAERNMSAAEANIALRSSYVSLTEAVDKKSKVSDAEMTALISFARTTNASTRALDEQGRTVDEATRAHEANRKKLIDTAVQMGKSRAEAKRLADQYLATPKGVTTNIDQPGMRAAQAETKKYHDQLDKITRQIKTSVTVSGDVAAYRKLEKLLVSQQALKKGIPISAAQSAFNKNAFHSGGWTGPGGKYDEAGIVHADEFVVKKESRQRIERQAPGALDEMNATGKLPGYARGGLVAPFPVTAAVTRIPSYKEAMAAVVPQFSGVGRGGTLPFILAAVHSRFPGMRLISGFRPNSRTLSGNRSYHADNRAGDFPASREMAQWWNANYKARTKEFISPFQEYNIHNGQRHRYTGAVWNQHNFAGGNAHDHIAMINGGVIPEPVVGVGRSGRTYSFAENGRPERVLSAGQTAAGGGTVTIAPVIHINGSNISAKQIAAEVSREIGRQADAYARSVA